MDRKIFIRLPNLCRHIRCWQASTPKLKRNCWLRCTEIKYTYWLFTGKSIIYWKIKHMHFVRRLICWLFIGLVEYRLMACLYNSIFKNVYIFRCFYCAAPPLPQKRKVGPFCFTSHFFRGWFFDWNLHNHSITKPALLVKEIYKIKHWSWNVPNNIYPPFFRLNVFCKISKPNCCV